MTEKMNDKNAVKPMNRQLDAATIGEEKMYVLKIKSSGGYYGQDSYNAKKEEADRFYTKEAALKKGTLLAASLAPMGVPFEYAAEKVD
ncbi:hypothetical protein [Pediococcus parvulus]|uniref:hypothetical protein n=1 Tax=Pediococcus parvulus TaxID=54062 RepID=UPI00345ECE65